MGRGGELKMLYKNIFRSSVVCNENEKAQWNPIFSFAYDFSSCSFITLLKTTFQRTGSATDEPWHVVNQITCLPSGKNPVKSIYMVGGLWAAFSLSSKPHLSICITWSGVFGLHVGILCVWGFCCISFSFCFLVQNAMGRGRFAWRRDHAVKTSKPGAVCEMRINLG